MLAPLDTRILDALSHDADDDEERDYDPHDHIGIVKALIAKNRNWSQGILRLLSFWPTMDPAFYRKKPLSTSHPLYNKGGPNNWWIAFHDPYFNSLRLKPRARGIIDLYAFDKRAQSFQIIGCRQNLRAMIEWIWDYGNRIEAAKPKKKVPTSYVRPRHQRPRVEKPLLRKVLNTAKFKAQRGKLSKAKDFAVMSEGTDMEMDDVDPVRSPCNNVPDTEDIGGHMGSALQERGISGDGRTPDPGVAIENVDIQALKIVDHHS